MRLAFLTPSALIDPASGAARSIATLMTALQRTGVRCFALTASCFDSSCDENLAGFLEERGMQSVARIPGTGLAVWRGEPLGFPYLMMRARAQRRGSLTAAEEMSFRGLAVDWLKKIKPDVVITYGGLLLDIELQRQAQRAGAAVVFYLANPNYHQRETFENVDLLLTNSSSTATLYASRLQLRCENIGLFVDPGPLRVGKRSPDYVTFINPEPEKGVTLFLKLVERAARECPAMRFLVVESRARLAPALERIQLPATLLERITLVPRQSDMRDVYRQTRVLLMPSFWFEAAGRVLIEATANGIPVIATNRGGIPETLGACGILLDIPEGCTKDYWQVPADAEVSPWWSALHALWFDREFFQYHSAKALQAAAVHSIDAKTQRVLRLLNHAVVRRRQKT